ncbi:MAG: PTS fructose transporter subunit IIA [Gammaproteobacteria bacterium]
MTVGLLIITHDRIGRQLLDTATRMLGICPLATRTVSVSGDCNPDATLLEAQSLVRELDQGGGVLVLTDMYGSTPSNIAARLLGHDGVRVVAGVNLPMLVRVLNYPRLGLDELADKAVSGGRDGVLPCNQTKDD